LADLSHRRARRRLRAGGTAYFRQSQCRGKSQGSAGAWRPLDHRAYLPAVSAAGRTQAQPRPPAFRRRAGDAVDRPRAAGQPEALDSRRAVAGTCAAGGTGGVPHHHADEGGGISVLLVEQNARMSLEIADDAYVLDDGIVVYSGTARELAADDARVRSLAGASAEEWTLA